VKHEAFAVAKLNGRTVATEAPLAWEADQRAWTHERAERYEQLRVGAEAMAALKPQEIRCLLMKAEGLSYQEICEATGFSYTKVNRCLTEGRRAFLKRVAGIESGAECERLEPLISKVADGEASAASCGNAGVFSLAHVSHSDLDTRYAPSAWTEASTLATPLSSAGARNSSATPPADRTARRQRG
jgi:hypothetical protein